VSDALTALLAELEVFDRATTRPSRIGPRRMLNITRDTGEFRAALVKATNATRVLKIGTSNGYSTLGLARAVRSSGQHPDESRTET